MAVKVLTAGDLVGWDNWARHGLLSCGTPVKPIRRESSELYMLYYPCVYLKIIAIGRSFDSVVSHVPAQRMRPWATLRWGRHGT